MNAPRLLHTACLSFLVLTAAQACRPQAPLPWDKASAEPQKSPNAMLEGSAAVRLVTAQNASDDAVVHVHHTLRSARRAVLSASAAGTLDAFVVRVGDRVKAGQALVRLNPVEAEAALQRAHADVQRARAEAQKAAQTLRRNQQLQAAQSGSVANLEVAQATFAAAEADLKKAQAGARVSEKALADTVLRAPFEGVVVHRQHEMGERVSPGSELVTVVDVSHLRVYLGVPEALAETLKVGDTLHGTASPADTPFNATVTVVGAMVDTLTHNVEVRLSLHEGVALRPGAWADVEIPSPAASPLLPRHAVQDLDGPEPYVWLLQDGHAHRQPVSAQAITHDTLQLKQALPRHTQVITPQGSLQDGQAVYVIDSTPAS